jgi:ribosome-binding protein aMBF1 (putative translation factor)
MGKAKNYTSNLLDSIMKEISADEQEKTDKKMLLAARIDDAIKAKGWKKKDFATAMNKKPSEISKWLSGTHNFNSDTLFDIEPILGICLINISETAKPQVTKYEILVSQKVELPKEKPYTNPYSPIYGLLNEENLSTYRVSGFNKTTNYQA